MNEDRTPRIDTGWGRLATLLGALLRGKRPEDRAMQKRAGVGAAFAVVVALLMKSDSRNDALVKAMREDSAKATAALLKSAESNIFLASTIDASTKQAALNYSEVLQKIPDYKPASRKPEIRPEKASH